MLQEQLMEARLAEIEYKEMMKNKVNILFFLTKKEFRIIIKRKSVISKGQIV